MSAAVAAESEKKFKGVRRRKWGKWVSEIRIPGSQERLWLGSYSSPEAAAVAHDVASYCLRGRSSVAALNFPLMLPSSVRDDMTPKSVQRVASDAGMAVDAQIIMTKSLENNGGRLQLQLQEDGKNSEIPGGEAHMWEDVGYGNWQGNEKESDLSISVEDYL